MPTSLVDTCGTGGGRSHDVQHLDGRGAARRGRRRAHSEARQSLVHVPDAAAPMCSKRSAFSSTPRWQPWSGARARGIVFMYAPLMHPAMRHVGPVRRELAIPTVMNVVGPLANPAGARRQVVGVADPQRVPVLAGALLDLDSLHSMVVHGEPGLDEISPLGPTRVVEVRDGSTSEWTIDPDGIRLHRFYRRRGSGGRRCTLTTRDYHRSAD